MERKQSTVNVHEAKTHLSRLLARVEQGEDIVIARAGRPIARLSKYVAEPEKRVMGRDAGLFVVPADFDDPLPDDVLRSFEE